MTTHRQGADGAREQRRPAPARSPLVRVEGGGSRGSGQHGWLGPMWSPLRPEAVCSRLVNWDQDGSRPVADSRAPHANSTSTSAAAGQRAAGSGSWRVHDLPAGAPERRDRVSRPWQPGDPKHSRNPAVRILIIAGISCRVVSAARAWACLSSDNSGEIRRAGSKNGGAGDIPREAICQRQRQRPQASSS